MQKDDEKLNNVNNQTQVTPPTTPRKDEKIHVSIQVPLLPSPTKVNSSFDKFQFWSNKMTLSNNSAR